MTEVIQIAGSFATVWLGLWCLLAVLLTIGYIAFRRSLLTWHPIIASNLSLLFLAFPFLLSLSCTLFMFLPVLESILVSSHCHDDCSAHAPLIDISEVAIVGVGLIVAVLSMILFHVWRNIRNSVRLRKQLMRLSTSQGEYFRLNDDQPFVFTLGWWTNQIFITDGLKQRCSEQDLQVILAHEQAHARRHDNVRLLAASLFSMVLPGKLARMMMEDFHLLIESACDFEASALYGDVAVAETLLKIQRLSPAQWNMDATAITTAFTGSEVEQRIKALVEGRHLSMGQQISYRISLALIVVASLGLVQPVHHSVEFLFSMH